MKHTRSLLFLLSLVTIQPSLARAEAFDPVAPQVALHQHPKVQLPRDLEFRDNDGNTRDLYEFADQRAPTLLVLASARCGAGCSELLDAVSTAIPQLRLEPGRDFHLLTVSLDAQETRKASVAMHRDLLSRIGYPEQGWRWPYLRAREEELTRLTEALGFSYAWNAGSRRYDQPAVAIVLTPKGRVARYLQGPELAAGPVAHALRAAAVEDSVRPLEAPSLAAGLLSYIRVNPAARTPRRFLLVMAVLTVSVTAFFAALRRKRERQNPQDGASPNTADAEDPGGIS